MTWDAHAVHWLAVLPVRSFRAAKSRFGDLAEEARRDLARALALDTIAAFADADDIDGVLVVTDDGSIADDPDLPPDVVVAVQSTPGLNGAVTDGLELVASAFPEHGVVVALADLPCLTPHTVAVVLRAACRHALGFVPDLDGDGTAMLTALPGVAVLPAFGPDSAARHVGLDHVRLTVPAAARRDVDTPAALAAAVAAGVGPWTAAVVQGAPA